MFVNNSHLKNKMGKASALFQLSLVLVMVVSCFTVSAFGIADEISALPPSPLHHPIALPPAPPPAHHHHHPHPHPPAVAPAPPPHHHHHHHHHPPPPPTPPAHPPVHPPPKPSTPPPPKPVTPPPKPATPPPPKHYTPPPKPATPPPPKHYTPPPKPATPPPKPATPPPKPYTPPPKPATPPPKPYTPPPKPVTPPPKPVTPPPKPATPPPKPYTPPPKPATPPPKPVTPPPAKPPTHPPFIPKQRSFVAVQGVVYCKSCKFAGKDTLLGATPVANATVRLVCKNTKYKIVDYAKTDKNGYFMLFASKTVTTYGISKCRASLLSSPLPHCQRPSLLHGGFNGAILRPEKPFIYNKKPFVLFNVGPFAFEPKCPRRT